MYIRGGCEEVPGFNEPSELNRGFRELSVKGFPGTLWTWNPLGNESLEPSGFGTFWAPEEKKKMPDWTIFYGNISLTDAIWRASGVGEKRGGGTGGRLHPKT